MSTSHSWLLLVVSLPTAGATARMRTWRNLKALGGAALRDGVYLLPDLPALREQLAALAGDTTREGGTAWLLDVTAGAEDDARYRALFDRGRDYEELAATLAAAAATLAGTAPADALKLLRKLRRDLEALRAIDFFPNDASARGQQAWQAFAAQVEALLADGEPQPVATSIVRCDPRDYQGRTWATRRRLWVDRVASAWLIRRFIDRGARFLWLATPADCPPGALGFDFDGAAFTHVGNKVSFEVLLASFGLDQDGALVRLGAMVRALDVGQGFVPEAAGFEAMLAGLRQRAPDDDALLAHATPILDALHDHFAATLANKDPA